MDKIDKAILTLNQSTAVSPLVTLAVDARCQIIVTIGYLAFMLSVPLTNLEQLAWYAVYPILWSTLCGSGYGVIFKRSLIVVPFVAFIGIFNPLFDHRIAFMAGDLAISEGWVTFTSIIIRGLLSVQAVILLINNTGFINMCRSLGALGLPGFLETQLMLLYRYMIVLLQEVQTMRRARESRGFGRKMPLKMWGVMIGQLFVRTVNRADRIHQAMLARRFNGRLMSSVKTKPISLLDLGFVAIWIAVFVMLRFVNIPYLLHFN